MLFPMTDVAWHTIGQIVIGNPVRSSIQLQNDQSHLSDQVSTGKYRYCSSNSISSADGMVWYRIKRECFVMQEENMLQLLHEFDDTLFFKHRSAVKAKENKAIKFCEGSEPSSKPEPIYYVSIGSIQENQTDNMAMEVDTDTGFVVNDSSSALPGGGFTKAYSNNLPSVGSEMVWNYVVHLMRSASENPDLVKILQAVASSKPDFSDDAICYVHLKRDDRICIVKGQLTVATNSGEAKIYQLTTMIDEGEDRILSVECSECMESGDCRHAVCFITWLHRKSEGDESSEVVCYFRGPLSAELESIPPKPPLNKTKAKNFIREIVRILQTEDIDCPLRWNFPGTHKKFANLSIHEMILMAVRNKFDTAQFFEHAHQVISASQSVLAEKTKFTPKFNPWYLELRYARITSAKVSDCINLNVTQSVLYETILGCHKEIDPNVQRKKLAVRQRLEKYTKTKYENCKITLNPNYPIIFDVPDGICQSHVIEIKCPKTRDHMQKYVTENGSICEKYYMEIQIHMYMHGKTAGVVCVADPDFENNNEIYMHSFNLNRNFAVNKLNKAMDYWKNIVYPELINSWAD